MLLNLRDYQRRMLPGGVDHHDDSFAMIDPNPGVVFHSVLLAAAVSTSEYARSCGCCG